MVQPNTQQEILFLTKTSVARTELDSVDPLSANGAPKGDQLETAIWNGLLFEILPELKEKNNVWEKMFLWQVNNYHSFISVNLSNRPAPVDPHFSVDPYLFSQTQFIN